MVASHWEGSTLFWQSRTDLMLVMRYLAAGLVNSLFGFAVITVCMNVLGWSPMAANAAGFLCGYLTGYLLHHRYSFRSDAPHQVALMSYLLVICIGYGVNAAVLFGLLRLGVHEVLSQALAVSAYVVVTFCLSRAYVYRRRR